MTVRPGDTLVEGEAPAVSASACEQPLHISYAIGDAIAAAIVAEIRREDEERARLERVKVTAPTR